LDAPLVVALPGNEALTARLADGLEAELAVTEFRRFPDGESYVRIDTPVAGRSVALVCTLDRPDEKFLMLKFAAATARELGAASIGLVAPYLCYLRQDKRFKPGEAVTSAVFAGLMSDGFDWLVTIDPHLHRLSGLESVYTIPTLALHAAPLIAQWITTNISNPLLIGPDSESEQWVKEIAAKCRAPHVVLEKRRLGDRAVKISVPTLGPWYGHTPVLIDDIISSARTMIEAASQIGSVKPIICIGVHGIFAVGAYEALKAIGAEVVTTNTILHETNAIDVAPLLEGAVRSLLGRPSAA
jgi:ribose-phosphate pyrophosphokinase